MQIAVVGAGYVGLVISLGFSKMGNKVICIDKNSRIINTLKKGIPTIYENGLAEMLIDCQLNRNLCFANDLKDAVEKTDIIFIVVNTPTKSNWETDLSQIYEVIDELSKIIESYKIIVIKSTVPVGTQKCIEKRLIKNGLSRQKFDIVSNPEFLREGTALEDFLHGDRFVIGSDSEKAKKVMKKLYSSFGIEIVFTTPETAELIKYSSNAFLATKISFINEIANLCNKVGANIDTIAYSMGLDKRISPEFLKAGIGFGGACLPKDIKSLAKVGDRYGCDLDIVKSVIAVNEKQKTIPVKILLDKYNDLKGKNITILGLAYKPNTDDIREAPSLYIIKELLKRGAIINCYDPGVSSDIKRIYPQITYCDDIYTSLTGSFCAIICTEWNEISALELNQVKNNMKIPMIIDGRNTLDLEKVKNSGITYYSIGRG